MEIPFTSPQLNKTSFNCPHCRAFSSMNWNDVYNGYMSQNIIYALKSAYCAHCKEYSLWVGNAMIYPGDIDVQSPNSDLSDEIQADYLEAASILNKSPRGAAALLRLSIEKLVNYLGVEGKDLNAKIGNLVTKGLNQKIQKSLDMVRVIGNEAVHPGQIDLNDSPETAHALFKLVNVIADDMITKPKEVDLLYEELIPESHKDGISRRDAK